MVVSEKSNIFSSKFYMLNEIPFIFNKEYVALSPAQLTLFLPDYFTLAYYFALVSGLLFTIASASMGGKTPLQERVNVAG